jgi:hypothetical protein
MRVKEYFPDGPAATAARLTEFPRQIAKAQELHHKALEKHHRIRSQERTRP